MLDFDQLRAIDVANWLDFMRTAAQRGRPAVAQRREPSHLRMAALTLGPCRSCPPPSPPPTVSRVALVNAVANGVIVVTGGAVRLTGSGLGCPTWPRCTDASFVADAASWPATASSSSATGLLTFVLTAAAIATVVAVFRSAPARPAPAGRAEPPRHPGAGAARRRHRADRAQPVDRSPRTSCCRWCCRRRDDAVAALPRARGRAAAAPPSVRAAGRRHRRRDRRRAASSARSSPAAARTAATRRPAAPASTPSWSASCTPTSSSCWSG